ncbi:alpha/beta fold hydrolase [Paenibacillus sp. P32E]|uniref:alpha/beta fold hydrolase n=1 Tax=Paenibacillus sp. P32E TaxID=1349434 RepID=UPI000961A03B|nr:alpha/beta fold hydrolase [Paenibacillus sp. P32E]OKP94101.1 hypothetical protein A3848_03470 [Paenibacillus sp. P32E]
MRNKLSLILACVLLLGVWSWSAPAAHGAALKTTFSVNNEVVKFPVNAAPFAKGNTVLVPIRKVGIALGLEVNYIKEQKVLQLSRNGQQITLKLGANEAILNGKDKFAIEEKAVLQGNLIYVPISLLNAMGLVVSYDSSLAQVRVYTPQVFAEKVTGLLASNQHEVLWQQFFNESSQKAISVAKLQQVWQGITETFGKYLKIDSVSSHQVSHELTIASTAIFTKGNLTITITTDSSGEIKGLWFAPAAAATQSNAPELKLPDGVTEEEVVVGAGTSHPLKGLLTLPNHSTHPLASVVLVQGSGASDRDETVFAYKPFRDIAYGLAKQGIAVLRYDKRSYSYPEQFIGAAAATVSVKDETVDDAVAASKVLKADKRMNPAQVYLVGHSLGGMLAPRIDADGGSFAGLILLAGSPRSLLEIIYDQNMASIQNLSNSDPRKTQTMAAIDAESSKGKELSAMTLEQSKAMPSVFGVPAYYFKEMDMHPTAELARKLTKPVLVLQGADDFQVYPDKDFPQWKDVLKGNPAASFKLYPGLNHFFVNDEGENAGTAAGYNKPGMVDPQVIADMGQWILNL